jgi:hypothetical protein
MKTCYENDMKAFKSCMNAEMYEHGSTEDLRLLPAAIALQRTLKPDRPQSDLSFDELVKVATDIVLDAKESYTTTMN